MCIVCVYVWDLRVNLHDDSVSETVMLSPLRFLPLFWHSGFFFFFLFFLLSPEVPVVLPGLLWSHYRVLLHYIGKLQELEHILSCM